MSQNVCFTASAAVAGVGKVPEKLMIKVKMESRSRPSLGTEQYGLAPI